MRAVDKLFAQHSDPVRAAGAKAYMRGLFDYFGISTPARRELQKKFHAEHALPSFGDSAKITRLCWKHPCREMQYFAMELCYMHRKNLPRESLALFEYMIRNKSWWDSVDFISVKLIPAYFQQYPEVVAEKTGTWISSGHIWLMRTAIIFQNNLKKKTDEKLLFSMVRQSAWHEDFFVRKAIGWALRQYGRTNPRAVKDFTSRNEKLLSPLSYLEAIRNL